MQFLPVNKYYLDFTDKTIKPFTDKTINKYHYFIDKTVSRQHLDFIYING